MMMMTDNQWEELAIDHGTKYLRADICLGSPESYSLEEKRQICEDMAASTEEVEAAIKADFSAMPPTAQAAMLDLLQLADPAGFPWWLETLVGKTPDEPPAEQANR